MNSLTEKALGLSSAGNSSDSLVAGAFAAAQAVEDMLLVVDDSITVIYANPALVKRTGFELGEVLERKAHSLVKVPDDISQVKAVLECLSAGNAWEGAMTLARKEQDPIEIQVTIQPVATAEGGEKHYVCRSPAVSRDGSAKKKRKHLESLSHLANGVAHRFNNLLASVMGQTELIGMLVEDNPGVQERVSKIMETSQRGKAMVGQLMQYCKKQEPRLRSVDFIPIVKNAIRVVQGKSSEEVDWQIDLPENAPLVRAVSSDMHDSVVHLLQNAVDALEGNAGQVCVSVEFNQVGEEAEDSERWIRLSIRDTGTGIPESVMPYIFEPFYTTHNMATTVGMGLAIVQGIVHTHGGEIQCQSVMGEGTTMEVTLPATADYSEGEDDNELGPRGHGEHIVLVDDQAMITEAGASQLEELGYHVITYNDALSAVKGIEKDKRPVDLVITDFRMPDVSGIDLARMLKEKETGIPVLLTYALSEQVEFSEKDKELFIGFLSKPCAIQELAGTVRTALDERT